MNLTGVKAAFQTEITAIGVPSFYMSNTFDINQTKKIEYPVVWMLIPDSTKLKEGHQRGWEEFAINFIVLDKQRQKTETDKLTRLDELEVIANKVFRDIGDVRNKEIIDYSSLGSKRNDDLYQDKLLGVEMAITLTVFTGWDCV